MITQKIHAVTKIILLVALALLLEQLAAATFSYFIVTEMNFLSQESNVAILVMKAIATAIPMFMICGFVSLLMMAFSRLIFRENFAKIFKTNGKDTEAWKGVLIHVSLILIIILIGLLTLGYMKTAETEVKKAGIDPIVINLIVIAWFLVLARYFEYADKDEGTKEKISLEERVKYRLNMTRKKRL
jgi:heme/copper-type cytochrome/quinol oxidase subunit 2